MKIEVSKPTDKQLEEMQVTTWETWSCPVSTFPWHYDEKETCYIITGQASVAGGGHTVEFGPGDMVIFPAGLSCVWTVTAPIKKHYKMG